LITSVLAHF